MAADYGGWLSVDLIDLASVRCQPTEASTTSAVALGRAWMTQVLTTGSARLRPDDCTVYLASRTGA
jgi:hypothetical protein